MVYIDMLYVYSWSPYYVYIHTCIRTELPESFPCDLCFLSFKLPFPLGQASGCGDRKPWQTKKKPPTRWIFTFIFFKQKLMGFIRGRFVVNITYKYSYNTWHRHDVRRRCMTIYDVELCFFQVALFPEKQHAFKGTQRSMVYDEYILPKFLESVRYAAVIHPMMLAGVRNVERNRPPAT